MSGQINRNHWRRIFTRADITESIAVAKYARQGVGELEIVGVCSGAWYAAHVARNIGAVSAIMVNPLWWNWRVTPTLLHQFWSTRRKTLNGSAACGAGGDPEESKWIKRLKALLNPARKRTKDFIHDHLPRYVLRVLSWVGLLFLPEEVLTTLARREVDVTVIASPGDAEEFIAKGGRSSP